jgi:transcriptional regulator with XRE-family HTH domain
MGTEGMQIESRQRGSYALVRCDENQDGRIPPGFPVLESKSLNAVRRYQHVFVLCSALHLREAAKFVSEINRQHRLQALFVRTDVDAALLPQMLDRAGLRFVRNILVHSKSSLPHRVLAAWLKNAQAELIARAIVADDRLILVSCEPKTYEIGFDQMPALKRITPAERNNFELAEDGSFIWWPSADIHLDLDAIRTVIDPGRRKRAERFRQEYGREYGSAIAEVRKDHGLRQTDIPGLSERQLRRIEESGSVSVRTIEQLAKAHRLSTGDYLDALAHKLGSDPHANRENVIAEESTHVKPEAPDIPNYSIAPTEKGFSYWMAQPYLDEMARHEAASADLLLIPQETFRDKAGPLFPVGTEEFLAFLRDQSRSYNCKVDICISDADYQELALHGEVLVLSEIVVKFALLPIATKLVADYIGRHLWSSKESHKAKVGITVDMVNLGKDKTVKITYDGPADEFSSAMHSATEALERWGTDKDTQKRTKK